jgi:hypothetical protein
MLSVSRRRTRFTACSGTAGCTRDRSPGPRPAPAIGRTSPDQHRQQQTSHRQRLLIKLLRSWRIVRSYPAPPASRRGPTPGTCASAPTRVAARSATGGAKPGGGLSCAASGGQRLTCCYAPARRPSATCTRRSWSAGSRTTQHLTCDPRVDAAHQLSPRQRQALTKVVAAHQLSPRSTPAPGPGHQLRVGDACAAGLHQAGTRLAPLSPV